MVKIETGLKEFSLNDVVTITFNPTDSVFVKKLYNQIEALESKAEEYNEAFKKAANTVKIFELQEQADSDMRTALNGLFGVDIVTPLIGDGSTYAYAGGTPLWFNIIVAIMELIEKETGAERKKSAEKIAKYTKKYSQSKYIR